MFIASVCILAGIGAGVSVFALPSLAQTLSAALASLGGWLASDSVYVIGGIVGLALVVSGILLLLPRREVGITTSEAEHRSAATRNDPESSMAITSAAQNLSVASTGDPQHPSAVSVHLDWENQPMNIEQLETFMISLRKAIAGRPADLFFYADAALMANDEAYKMLWRYGFRPIDVMHQHGDTKHVANIVDFELALHAYQRALTATVPLHFIIISGDQGYLPLLYRLHAAGHQVSVWAKVLPNSYRNLQRYLSIDVVKLEGIFDADDTTTVIRSSKNTIRQQMQNTIKLTRNLIEEIIARQQSLEKRLPEFQATANERLPALATLGFDGNDGPFAWMHLLVLMGVLKSSPRGQLPPSNNVKNDRAAHHLYHVCKMIAGRVSTLARSTPDGVITSTAIQFELLRPPTLEEPKIGFIQAYIKERHDGVWRICELCRALGLLDYTTNEAHDTLLIKIPDVVGR